MLKLSPTIASAANYDFSEPILAEEIPMVRQRVCDREA